MGIQTRATASVEENTGNGTSSVDHVKKIIYHTSSTPRRPNHVKKSPESATGLTHPLLPQICTPFDVTLLTSTILLPVLQLNLNPTLQRLRFPLPRLLVMTPATRRATAPTLLHRPLDTMFKVIKVLPTITGLFPLLPPKATLIQVGRLSFLVTQLLHS